MKTKLLTLALGLSAGLWAQPTWQEILPESNGSRYDDVFFLNPNLGWAAGSGGFVYKTQDGGAHWELQLDLGDIYIRNIEFLNENVGFLGTLNGGFYKTNDGGNHWTLVNNVVPANGNEEPNDVICGLDAVGTHTIYGCGTYFGPAYIIKSVDSGATWQFIDMSAYAESLVEVLFVDENTGFASGGNSNGGVILKTTNGGASWTEIYHTGINGEWVWKLQRLFSNPEIMFGSVESMAPLNGKLVKSVDGGQNWVSKEVPDTDIQAVGFNTENHGWMGGHHTGFLETFDAGNTWTNTGFGGSLNRIQFFDENLAYCAGNGIYKFSDENLGTTHPSGNAEREKLEVHIAPNPVGNQLEFNVNFKSADHIILRLFDNNGKWITEFKTERITSAGKKNYSFPFPYPAGTYYLSLHNDSGEQAEKIIKK
ncbi:T9SS type A sorting domain-containing protein [Flavobacterium lotistagni]|uniref:T9SS type A sorting domain-containing protein n=1 Tax=Flavobacterium lotistagni TaxID=2709660 RepID=UPI001F2F5CAF|nr:T9SS type A sorting domain-containing protein [Flavobacterium lotistagni]